MSIFGYIIDKIFDIICLPIYIFVYFFYDVDNIKKTVLNDFYAFYKDEIFNSEDYKLKIDLFSGFTIINKHTGVMFATSSSLALKYIVFELPLNCFNKAPIKNSHKLNEYFDIEEFVTISYVDNKRYFTYELRLSEKVSYSNKTDFIQMAQFNYNADIYLNSIVLIEIEQTKLPERIHIFDNQFPLDELFDFIILNLIARNENIRPMFPEINIPSAYDFSDFKERIEIAKMIYY